MNIEAITSDRFDATKAAKRLVLAAIGQDFEIMLEMKSRDRLRVEFSRA